MLLKMTCTLMIAVFPLNLNAEKPDSKRFQRKVECERMACFGISKRKCGLTFECVLDIKRNSIFLRC